MRPHFDENRIKWSANRIGYIANRVNHQPLEENARLSRQSNRRPRLSKLCGIRNRAEAWNKLYIYMETNTTMTSRIYFYFTASEVNLRHFLSWPMKYGNACLKETSARSTCSMIPTVHRITYFSSIYLLHIEAAASTPKRGQVSHIVIIFVSTISAGKWKVLSQLFPAQNFQFCVLRTEKICKEMDSGKQTCMCAGQLRTSRQGNDTWKKFKGNNLNLGRPALNITYSMNLFVKHFCVF